MQVYPVLGISILEFLGVKMSNIEGKDLPSSKNSQPGLRAASGISSSTMDKRISRREIEVLGCLAKGMTTGQISSSLFISENTVKTHIRHILGKLGATSRIEAVTKASKIGLIREV